MVSLHGQHILLRYVVNLCWCSGGGESNVRSTSKPSNQYPNLGNIHFSSPIFPLCQLAGEARLGRRSAIIFAPANLGRSVEVGEIWLEWRSGLVPLYRAQQPEKVLRFSFQPRDVCFVVVMRVAASLAAMVSLVCEKPKNWIALASEQLSFKIDHIEGNQASSSKTLSDGGCLVSPRTQFQHRLYASSVPLQ